MRTNEDQTTRGTAPNPREESLEGAATEKGGKKKAKSQVTATSAPSAQERASTADANMRGDSDSNEL